MGNIQNKMNGALGTTAAALAMASHINEQAKANDIKVTELEAEQATNAKEIESAKTAYANDLKEAQQAILAHADEEKLTDAEKIALESDPEYAQDIREKLKENREAALQEAGLKYREAYDKLGVKPEQEASALKKAYDRLEETNKRIDTTNKLKFDVESRLAKQEVLAKKLQVLK